MKKLKDYRLILVIDDSWKDNGDATFTHLSYMKQLLNSGNLQRIASEYEVDVNNIAIIDVDEFSNPKSENSIMNSNDTLYLAFGREFYDKLRELNDAKYIHIGLRNFNYIMFSDLPFVSIGTNRVVFDAFGREDAVHRFFSDESKRQYLQLPQTKCVGLKEGKQILDWLTENITHEFDNSIDVDWYKNPTNVQWKNEIGFDFETRNNYTLNEAFPELYGTEVTGFALSWDNAEEEGGKSFFFDFRSDYNYDEKFRLQYKEQFDKEYEEFLVAMTRFFDKHYKHIWAYNAAFEYLMLWKLLRKFYDIQDSYALCIANDDRHSLKYNVQKLLRCPSWDDKLDEQMDDVELLGKTFENYKEFCKYAYKWNKNKLTEDEKNNLPPEVFDIFEYYKENQDRLPLLRDNWGGGWGACVGASNHNDLGVYCCYDAYYGLELARLLMPIYGNNCYWEILQHRYIQAELKLHGMRVDKKRTLHLMKYCNTILTNFELIGNQLIIDNYFKSCPQIYKTLKVKDALNNVLKETPDSISCDAKTFGKNLIEYIYNKAYDKGLDYIPVQEFSDLANVDLSDELQFLVDEGWTIQESIRTTKSGVENIGRALSGKKKYTEFVGELFLKLTDIKSIMYKFNAEQYKLFKDKQKEQVDKVKHLWILESCKLGQATDLIDEITKWKENVSTTDTIEWVEYKKDEPTDDSYTNKVIGKHRYWANQKLIDNIWKKLPDFDEKELQVAFDMPDEVLNQCYGIYDIEDDSKQYDNKEDKEYYGLWYNYQIDDYILPKVKEQFEFIEYPSMTGFIKYYYMLKLESEMNNINMNHTITVPSTYKDTNELVKYEDIKERLSNFFSADQNMIMNRTLGYTGYKNIIQTMKSLYFVSSFDEEELDKKYGVWEDEYNDDRLAFFKYFVRNVNSDRYVQCAKRKMFNYDIYDLFEQEEKKEKYLHWSGTEFHSWNGCCGSLMVNVLTKDIQHEMLVDMNILPKDIVDCFGEGTQELEYVKQLWKMVEFCVYRNLAGVAQKTLSTYCNALDSMTIKIPYNKDRHITTTVEEVLAHDSTYYKKEDGWLQCGMFVHDIYQYCIAEHIYDSAEDGDKWCDSIPDLWYVPNFQLNNVETKRNSSPYHTWKHGSEYQKCLLDEEERCHCYFDVSQLEPRSIAYLSGDPEFRGKVYEAGVDAYVSLARLSFPDDYNQILQECNGDVAAADKRFRKEFRGYGKNSLISIIYGRGDVSLAGMMGCDPHVVSGIREAMMGGWKRVAELRDHKTLYTHHTGMIETFLGDRLVPREGGSKALTQSVNYANQGSSSLIATASFRNSCKMMREKCGIETYVTSIIHDSTQQSFPIKNIFEAYIIYNKYFRQYIKERYDIDYKFDLDICRDYMHNLSFSYNPKTKEGSLSGNKVDMDYIMNELGNDIKIISDETKDDKSDCLDGWLKNNEAKGHLFCNLPDFDTKSVRTVSFIVQRKVIGEDTFADSLNVKSYWDIVQTWDEHPNPYGFKFKFEENVLTGDEKHPYKQRPIDIDETPYMKQAYNKIYPADLSKYVIDKYNEVCTLNQKEFKVTEYDAGKSIFDEYFDSDEYLQMKRYRTAKKAS